MVETIKLLAIILGMGEGELLKLAREIAEDGALVAIEFLPYAAQDRLMSQLCWMRDLGKDLDRVPQVAYDP